MKKQPKVTKLEDLKKAGEMTIKFYESPLPADVLKDRNGLPVLIAMPDLELDNKEMEFTFPHFEALMADLPIRTTMLHRDFVKHNLNDAKDLKDEEKREHLKAYHETIFNMLNRAFGELLQEIKPDHFAAEKDEQAEMAMKFFVAHQKDYTYDAKEDK